MKEAFLDELRYLIKSVWFWVGIGVYLLAEVFYSIQPGFDGGVLNYYQFSFNAQYVVVLYILFLLANAYFSASADYDVIRFPTVKRVMGQATVDILVGTLVIFIVSFTKFLIGEISNGGFTDPDIAKFATFSYFYFFLCKTVFLIASAAIIGRCFHTIMQKMPYFAIIVYCIAAFLSFPLGGLYADMMHSVLENKLAGQYAEALANEVNETHLILTWRVLLNGFFALTVILGFVVFTVLLTRWVFNRNREFYEMMHAPQEEEK